MATNIIEKFAIELGLDFSKYAANVDKAVQKDKQLEKSLNDTEKASKKTAKGFNDLSKEYLGAMQVAAEFGKTIASVTKGITGLFSAILVSTGLNKLVNDVARANDELFFLEKNLGMSAQKMGEWRGVAEASGGSAEGMTASISALKQSMNKMVMFGDTSMLPYFNALGVSMVDGYGKVRDMNDVMLDLADSFQKMPRDQAFTLAKQMGLDEGTINTLMQGRKELEGMLAIQRQMYRSDEKALAASREMNKQRAILNAHWESMKNLLADALIPVVTKLLEVVNSFMMFLQKHQNTIKHVFQGAAIVITALLIPALVSGLTAALAFIAPFAPFILVVGGLAAAFIALYDDYKTWAEGGKSLFDWSAFQRLIDSNILSIDGLKNGFKGLVNELLNSVVPAFRDVMEIIKKLQDGDIKGAWASLVSLGSRPVEAFLNTAQYLGEKAANAIDAVAGVNPDSDESLSHQMANSPRAGTEFRNAIVHGAGGGKDMMEDTSRKSGRKAPSATVRDFAKALFSVMDDFGITDKKDKAAFLANVDHETGGGKRLSEDTRYSLKGWRGLAANQRNIKNWLKSHEGNQEAAFKSLSNEDKLNIMYAGMNGNNQVGDGYKFRGRGGIQLTGRANYQSFANYMKRQDIMENPDLVASDPKLAAAASAWFWKIHSNASNVAKSGDFVRARKIVNGGSIGMEDAKAKYQEYINGKGSFIDGLKQSNIINNAQQAQNMITQREQMQTASNMVKNDNRKQVNVNVQKINVQSSASTVEGTATDAVKGLHNYMFNQLGTSMS